MDQITSLFSQSQAADFRTYTDIIKGKLVKEQFQEVRFSNFDSSFDLGNNQVELFVKLFFQPTISVFFNIETSYCFMHKKTIYVHENETSKI